MARKIKLKIKWSNKIIMKKMNYKKIKWSLKNKNNFKVKMIKNLEIWRIKMDKQILIRIQMIQMKRLNNIKRKPKINNKENI